MHNILLAAVRLRSEAAVWRGSGKYILFMKRKAFKNPNREVDVLVRAQVTGLQY